MPTEARLEDPQDCQRLWKAVICQAFQDAVSSEKYPLRRDIARAWLLTRSRDLFNTCVLAGEDIEDVIAAAYRMQANGWPLDGIERRHRYFTKRQDFHAKADTGETEGDFRPVSPHITEYIQGSRGGGHRADAFL